jgi:hypothetical protein
MFGGCRRLNPSAAFPFDDDPIDEACSGKRVLVRYWSDGILLLALRALFSRTAAMSFENSQPE